MEKTLYLRMAEAFTEKEFLRKLHIDQSEAARLFADTDWAQLLSPLLPIESRISCAQALTAFRPVLDALSAEPEEGWLLCAFQSACTLMYAREDGAYTADQKDSALCFLHFLPDKTILRALFIPACRHFLPMRRIAS